jgi:hypothetical protein
MSAQQHDGEGLGQDECPAESADVLASARRAFRERPRSVVDGFAPDPEWLPRLQEAVAAHFGRGRWRTATDLLASATYEVAMLGRVLRHWDRLGSGELGSLEDLRACAVRRLVPMLRLTVQVCTHLRLDFETLLRAAGEL